MQYIAERIGHPGPLKCFFIRVSGQVDDRDVGMFADQFLTDNSRAMRDILRKLPKSIIENVKTIKEK